MLGFEIGDILINTQDNKPGVIEEINYEKGYYLINNKKVDFFYTHDMCDCDYDLIKLTGWIPVDIHINQLSYLQKKQMGFGYYKLALFYKNEKYPGVLLALNKRSYWDGIVLSDLSIINKTYDESIRWITSTRSFQHLNRILDEIFANR